MEINNVSAQLFAKQLPEDTKASSYGCNNDFYNNNKSTCVDPVASDSIIEDAFQKQMDLNDYYKSKQVFEAMRKEFIDKTMDKEPTSVSPVTQEIVKNVPPVQVEPQPNSGPRDNIKERFGSNWMDIGVPHYILILLVIIIMFFTFF